MRTEPAPSQSGAERRGKARGDADDPHLRAGSRQFAVRLPRHRYLLARGATPSLTRSHWHRLVERSRRSSIFGLERARLSAPPHRDPVRERSRADACRHQDTAQFPGCDSGHQRLSDADEIPASETALGDWLITGLPDRSSRSDRARRVRALSFGPPPVSEKSCGMIRFFSQAPFAAGRRMAPTAWRPPAWTARCFTLKSLSGPSSSS